MFQSIKKFSVIAVVLFAGISSGCDVTGGNVLPDGSGSLTINLSMDNSRDLLPNISMIPALYEISGAGPGSLSFSTSTSQASVQVNNVVFGDWSVTVVVRNASNYIIAYGHGSATVSTGQTSTLNITAAPVSGTGTLNVTAAWDSADVSTPSIVSTLTPYSGTPQNLSFTVNPATAAAAFSSSTIATGYHTLIVQLYDNGVLVAGAVEIARIVNGGTTTGNYDFSNISQGTGNLLINIVVQMNEPLTVTMSGQSATLPSGSSMSVSASAASSVPAVTGSVVYVWYINGSSVGTGSSYTVNGTTAGIYRLDVTAFTADGSRAGSATYTYTVTN